VIESSSSECFVEETKEEIIESSECFLEEVIRVEETKCDFVEEIFIESSSSECIVEE